ncbi:hypothetical protein H257_13973 [Aphanomyces astaci]|uniref:Uncharacterized protein n=1 Tax=Aphanomyces astaci TaxID=112090 RepID=W4FVF0_APHAT|nr:hypothetical protein H257_13973 [Aphanomyces astaci]ETV70598.1 hypothetical protein H257_13973 [Aphanomyces astaci]|eukprot:XP_009839981.1 hypothetical protein H257_13973 [Aphanomyces astaci]
MTASKKPRIAVVGNTGIGKSYIQLVILLWWARPSLRRLDSTSTLLLYEVCVSKDEIQLSGITRGHLWATVSPLKDRYKEFSKYSAAVKYMECPYDDELVFMAAVMENDNARFLKAEDKAGWSELAELTLEKLQKAWFIIEKRSAGMLEISDRILRIAPVLDGVFTVNSYTLKLTNDLVAERLGNLMFGIDVQQLKRQLIAPAVKGSMSITLETFFVKYAAAHDIERRWEGWEVATAKFSANSNDDPNWTPQCEAFSLNVNQINRAKKPTYADFVAAPTSIFYMNDPGYSFVDCFWYDDNMKAVHAGQTGLEKAGVSVPQH